MVHIMHCRARPEVMVLNVFILFQKFNNVLHRTFFCCVRYPPRYWLGVVGHVFVFSYSPPRPPGEGAQSSGLSETDRSTLRSMWSSRHQTANPNLVFHLSERMTWKKWKRRKVSVCLVFCSSLLFRRIICCYYCGSLIQKWGPSAGLQIELNSLLNQVLGLTVCIGNLKFEYDWVWRSYCSAKRTEQIAREYLLDDDEEDEEEDLAKQVAQMKAQGKVILDGVEYKVEPAGGHSSTPPPRQCATPPNYSATPPSYCGSSG